METTQKIIKRNTRTFLEAFIKKMTSNGIQLFFANSGLVEFEVKENEIMDFLEQNELFERDEKDVDDEEFIKFYQTYVVSLAKLYGVSYVPLKDTNTKERILCLKNGKIAFIHKQANEYRVREGTETAVEEKLGFLYSKNEKTGKMDDEYGMIDEMDDMVVIGNENIEAVVKKNWKDVLDCDYKAKDQMLLGVLNSLKPESQKKLFSDYSHIDNSEGVKTGSAKKKPFLRDEKLNEEFQDILYSLRIVANKGMNFKDDENGQVLKDNFIKFYGIRHYPKYAEAHHIAPKKDSLPAASKCREIIINYLVDINHPCNCVPLPKDERRAKILGTAQHNGPCEKLHGKEIMKQLYDDLNVCMTVFSVINILSNYRLEM